MYKEPQLELLNGSQTIVTYLKRYHVTINKILEINVDLLGRALLIGLMAVSLQGCFLDEDIEAEETKIFTTDGANEVISSKAATYDIVIKADDTYLILKGDITEITIQGDDNYITVKNDTRIEDITISGDNNIIRSDDDIELTVDQLSIVGNANDVNIYDITTFNETRDKDGTENLVCKSIDATCLTIAQTEKDTNTAQ